MKGTVTTERHFLSFGEEESGENVYRGGRHRPRYRSLRGIGAAISRWRAEK